jgi:hypothetical protein
MSKLALFQVGLEWYEILLWLFYVFIGAAFVFFYKSYNDVAKNKYLLQGYFIKVFGGLFFALVYTYYYKGGDTFLYFIGISQFNEVMITDPEIYFKLLFSNLEESNRIRDEVVLNIGTGTSSEEWFMIRFSSILSLFGFNTYLGVTFFCSLLSFIGALLISKVMNEILQGFEKQIFWINFLLPSLVLWGGGLLKDTYTLFAFSVLVYLLFITIYKKFSIIKAIFIGIIPSIVLLELKPYILICFLPWLFITFFFKIINKSANPVAKFLILPYLLIVFSIVLYFGSLFLIDSSAEYNTQKIYKTIEGFHTWHKELGGSVYDLGEIEYTQFGLMKKIPAALNVTLFRPYLWEVKTFFSILTSLESTFFLFFFIFVIIKTKFNLFKVIRKNEFLFGAIIFILFFAFTIGISAFNFGALVRFKIPLVAFYVFSLFYALKTYQINVNKIEQDEKNTQ